MEKHYKTETMKKCKLEYATAYIVPQEYENLFSMKDILKTGTIFMDLYRPYVKKDDKSNIALIAKELSFYHPTTLELLTFSIPLPNTYPWSLFS